MRKNSFLLMKAFLRQQRRQKILDQDQGGGRQLWIRKKVIIQRNKKYRKENITNINTKSMSSIWFRDRSKEATLFGSPNSPNHPKKNTETNTKTEKHRTKRRSEATLVFGWGESQNPNYPLAPLRNHCNQTLPQESAKKLTIILFCIIIDRPEKQHIFLVFPSI